MEKSTTILQGYVENNKPISKDAASVADLKVDSTDIFPLVSRIEGKFNVEVSERAIREWVVVQDIMGYLDINCY
ncbi:hypothetical protein AMS62_09690 [Bacillus sp. FJAT-18019]|nr:hypothetical protein AMS62_09690 [Bacillus sp. FJAT-18019]